MAVVTATDAGPISDDEVLARRALQGDRSALEELFRRHRAVAYRVAYRLLGSEADALDAVQDGFVNAMTKLYRYEGRCRFRTWLLRVVANAAIDHGRRRSRQRREQMGLTGSFLEESVPTDADPMMGLEREELRGVLDRALATLSEVQRQTFVLYTDGDLNYRDVAEVQGVSIGTVMSRLYYARQKLRQQLEQAVVPDRADPR